MTDGLTRPIIGIENRTAQEAFDIMCDRIEQERLARKSPSPQPHTGRAGVSEAMVEAAAEALRKMYHGERAEDEPFHLMAKAALNAALAIERKVAP